MAEGDRHCLQSGSREKRNDRKDDHPCRMSRCFMSGDTCKKGDILVSGVLELKNDSQEVYQYQYVKADADVYIQYKLAYYHEVPMEYQEEVFAGTEEKGRLCPAGKLDLYFRGKERKRMANNLLNIIPGR